MSRAVESSLKLAQQRVAVRRLRRLNDELQHHLALLAQINNWGVTAGGSVSRGLLVSSRRPNKGSSRVPLQQVAKQQERIPHGHARRSSTSSASEEDEQPLHAPSQQQSAQQQLPQSPPSAQHASSTRTPTLLELLADSSSNSDSEVEGPYRGGGLSIPSSRPAPSTTSGLSSPAGSPPPHQSLSLTSPPHHSTPQHSTTVSGPQSPSAQWTVHTNPGVCM